MYIYELFHANWGKCDWSQNFRKYSTFHKFNMDTLKRNLNIFSLTVSDYKFKMFSNLYFEILIS